ncbi:MAG: D-amino acid dehydrogenase [Betaproteobacteria bacterium]|nr:D-amino acid dehydrogenase [Betaproteobacteria bacterium]
MHVIVLGAGVVGVTSAWYLREAGHEVTVIDRQPEAAQETSFANGGQISVSHAEPWANPAAPLKVLEWLGREDAPLLWRWRADWQQWFWGLSFLRECMPGRTRANIAAILRLALYSRASLQALRQTTGISYDHLERGILHLYFDEQEFAHAVRQAELMREFGCERIVKSAEECHLIEPALAHGKLQLVGGTYTADDESGDACQFTQKLADLCTQRGVEFRFNQPIDALLQEGGRIIGIRLHGGDVLTADAYIVALGSYSPMLLRPLGIKLVLQPGKGYSATLPLDEGSIAPTVSLIDDQHKVVFSRLGQRLRIAGTAEFAGYDTSLNAVRCQALLDRAMQLFPFAGNFGQAEFWAGLRPVTPGNVPLIGATRYSNLYLNTGHGTLGWTMACGSGRLLATLVSGKRLEISAEEYAPG